MQECTWGVQRVLKDIRCPPLSYFRIQTWG